MALNTTTARATAPAVFWLAEENEELPDRTLQVHEEIGTGTLGQRGIFIYLPNRSFALAGDSDQITPYFWHGSSPFGIEPEGTSSQVVDQGIEGHHLVSQMLLLMFHMDARL